MRDYSEVRKGKDMRSDMRRGQGTHTLVVGDWQWLAQCNRC
jgi:hypothetical protein